MGGRCEHLPYGGDCRALAGEVWFLVGKHFAMAEEWERSWAALERAADVMPMRGDLLMLQAVVAGKLGKDESAREAVARWEGLRPDDPMLAAVRSGLGAEGTKGLGD